MAKKTHHKERVVIIGAGPAGLTAAYELTRQVGYDVTVLEASGVVGGISRTVTHHGNRMDMGGHRLFSKIDAVNSWWEKLLPRQGAPASDDLTLKRAVTLAPNGPDPESVDDVMLRRHRLSRILFNGRFFDYPVTLSWRTLRTLGLQDTFSAGCSYLEALVHPLPETSLENFYINRFGRRLYEMFFENYTTNLWGRHPRDIDASWGAQRVKGVSIREVLAHAWQKLYRPNGPTQEASLIDEFSYPKLGPGQLWEKAAKEFTDCGGKLIFNAPAIAFTRQGDHINAVTYRHHGQEHTLPCDHLISSMPLCDLVAGLPDVPSKISSIAAGLPYRDYITVGVLLSRLTLTNHTRFPTVGNIIPDDWIYIHDTSVRLGRMQIYNNWSPYLVKDLQHTVWCGLEYFCSEGDDLWQRSDSDFTEFAIREMLTLGLIESPQVVLDTHVERVPKAYPAYFDTYHQINKLISYLDTLDNLYCIGRNGQHRYNNIDHSMCTAFAAVENIRTRRRDKSNIWSVNTEGVYHESKR